MNSENFELVMIVEGFCFTAGTLESSIDDESIFCLIGKRAANKVIKSGFIPTHKKTWDLELKSSRFANNESGKKLYRTNEKIENL